MPTSLPASAAAPEATAGATAGAAPFAAWSRCAGSHTVNVDPRPGSLRTVTVRARKSVIPLAPPRKSVPRPSWKPRSLTMPARPSHSPGGAWPVSSSTFGCSGRGSPLVWLTSQTWMTLNPTTRRFTDAAAAASLGSAASSVDSVSIFFSTGARMRMPRSPFCTCRPSDCHAL